TISQPAPEVVSWLSLGRTRARGSSRGGLWGNVYDLARPSIVELLAGFFFYALRICFQLADLLVVFIVSFLAGSRFPFAGFGIRRALRGKPPCRLRRTSRARKARRSKLQPRRSQSGAALKRWPATMAQAGRVLLLPKPPPDQPPQSGCVISLPALAGCGFWGGLLEDPLLCGRA